MLKRHLPLISILLACALLAACATKPTPPVAEHPYTGPRITLHPAPGAAALATMSGASPQSAIEYLNDRRAELGLMPIATDELVAKAAAAHARYLEVNRATGHDERAELPGFTGADVTARVRALTEVTGASEVFAIYGGQHPPDLPVAEIFASPYHRGAMLYDWARAGEAVLSGDSAITVVDFADPAPVVTSTELVAYPYPGQTDAPLSWTDDENPDPMGPESRYRGAVLGMPLTLSGGTNAHVDLASFELRDARGKIVRCHIAPRTPVESGRNTAVCTPYEPLKPGMHYTAHATGRLSQIYGASDVPFDLTWTFSTITPQSTASATTTGGFH
ncbi:CAP domain-containing protein [Paraburkholderia youngii]|uniref:CAP domain-containing protein n=1 Tax=Paraburkholderia youngii TaxID=2782701 RepID=UPI003D21C10E